jgi:hypothetical protein
VHVVIDVRHFVCHLLRRGVCLVSIERASVIRSDRKPARVIASRTAAAEDAWNR